MTGLLSPRLLAAHLVGLLAVGAAGTLGGWQYDAWQAQRAAEARDLTRLDPVPLSDAMGPDDAFPGRLVGHPVDVAGSWVTEGTVLVSGRERDGVDGYWVVTPLAVGGPGDPAVPVVRGWSAATDVPPPPQGEAELTGWLQPPEGTGATDADPTDDVLPQVRIADLVQHVDQDLYGAYLVATEPTAGLEPADLEQLPDVGRFTALRNLLYAIEWWVFGAFAAFLWWRFVQDTRAADGEPRPPGQDVEGDPIASDV